MVQVERNFVKAIIEDMKVPHHPNGPGDSWNIKSDYALIPKETFKDGKGV